MFGMLMALVTVLAAEPSTATVLVRRTSVPAAEASALLDAVTQRLTVPGLLTSTESQRRLAAFAFKDGTSCGGKTVCHQELGRQLVVDWLVLVSISQIADDQSLALELLSVASGEVVERESVLLARRGEVPGTVLESFSARVTARVRPKLASDAPVASTLLPTPPPPPPLELSQAPRSRAGGIILASAGVVALGAGVGLLINALALQRQVAAGTMDERGMVRSELSGSQAQALQDASSVQVGLAIGAGVLALGLGATAVAVW